MIRLTFDAGGLIALERNRRRVYILIDTILQDGGRLIIPATVLAQVLRNPARQVPLWRLIHSGSVDILPLDAAHAQAIGALLARSGTADIADAHVVVCARQTASAVITSDPQDLRALDAKLSLIEI